MHYGLPTRCTPDSYRITMYQVKRSHIVTKRKMRDTHALSPGQSYA